MVQLMSDSEFASGGPQNTGLGGTASGFGQLAQVLAQAPMMRARAGYYGAETGRAQAQTQQLQQQMDVAQGRQDRIREAMSLLSDPSGLRNPQVMTRLYSIAMGDPDLAAHINGLIGGIMALGGLQGKFTDAERDKTNASMGITNYGQTATGLGATLAQGNRNIITTGEQQRATDDNQVVQAIPPNAPPGTQPKTMRKGDANAQGWTILPPEAVSTGAGPATILPPTGGPPQVTSGWSAQQQGAQPVLPEGTAKGAVVQGTMFPPAPNAPPAANVPAPPPAPNAPPAANAPPASAPPAQQTGQADTGDKINLAQADTGDSEDTGDTGDQPPPGSPIAALMSGVQLAQNTPSSAVPGAVLAAGPAAGTPPAPAPQPQPPPQPPAPQPQPQPAPQPGQPPQTSPLGSAFSNAEATRLERLRQVSAALSGQPAVLPSVPQDTGMSSTDEENFQTLVAQSAADRYPQNMSLWHPGNASEWGPQAFNAINARAHDIYTTLGAQGRKNPGQAIQQAIQELESQGRIPPPGFRPSAGAIPFVEHMGYGRNVVELQRPTQGQGQPQGHPQGQPQEQPQGAQPPAQPQPAPPAQAAQQPPAQGQAPTATNQKTGQKYVLVNGQWLEVVNPSANSNQPPTAQAQGQ